MVPVVLIRRAVLTHAEIMTFDSDEFPTSREPHYCFANVALNRRQMRCVGADREQLPEVGRI
jgi:hypothetical protein